MEGSASGSSTALLRSFKEKNDFLLGLEAYSPTIPEAVTKYYMQKSGVEVLDERMVKLISLAADHFLATTVREAKQMSQLKHSQKGKAYKRKATDIVAEDTLDLEDVERSLQEQGVFLRKG